ncbi:hypothetical protein BHE74_00001653 [Ensete ventricosum]|uniref:Uncharacterized protein n=1 Tax=Ensete ventricosum TaxID=4639 RepID=A0A427A9U1_ENSVE|nr:hypothetical protein B296_00014625 [Ensete ventricosum]RWW89401.1 hypothetical protein BHE74_00001653 [Ensete ventricosum]RZR81983.1 hypothetical protein BHM03_00008314 [Ensete ventricosum]
MSRGHRALTFDSTGKTGPKTEILLSHEEKAMPLGRRWSAAGWVPRPNIYGFGFQESDTHPPRWQRGPHVLPSCFANVHGKRKPNERNPDQKTDGARKRVEGRPAQEEDAGTRVRPRQGVREEFAPFARWDSVFPILWNAIRGRRGGDTRCAAEIVRLECDERRRSCVASTDEGSAVPDRR